MKKLGIIFLILIILSIIASITQKTETNYSPQIENNTSQLKIYKTEQTGKNFKITFKNNTNNDLKCVVFTITCYDKENRNLGDVKTYTYNINQNDTYITQTELKTNTKTYKISYNIFET